MSVTELINSINGVTDSPTELTEEDRLTLLAACSKLKTRLENPREATFRFVFASHQGIALRLAIDMELFDAAAQLSANGDEISLEGLASKMMTVDPLLLVRVMRFLVGMEIFHEVGQGTYRATSLSRAYVSASPLAQAVIHMTSQNEVISALPSYFSENGYQNPGDAYDGPFQYAHSTKLHCFDWLATKPKLQHAFNVVLGIVRSAHVQPWFEFFPVSSKLSVISPSDTLIVDIGGGIGHDLIGFKKHYPTLPGTLILQDIPVVIDSITDLPSGIEAMKHDFFAPQPVKGAKAYYLAKILHDWPDKQALLILANIREAMDADSVLLINENMMPESGGSLYSASSDLIMMANFGAMERTERQFAVLLEQAGFELVKAWRPDDDGVEGERRRLLEAVVKKM